jgi:hypothetical protein
MEKPTIWSSRPDPMRRTVCRQDAYSLRVRYGRIKPMESRKTLISRIVGIVWLN